jgi:hypothetical protein
MILTRKILYLTSLFTLAVLISGCATKLVKPPSPDYFENAKYKSTPVEKIRADENECLYAGDQYIKDPGKWEALRQQRIKEKAAAKSEYRKLTKEKKAEIPEVIFRTLSGLAKLKVRTPSYEKFVEQCLLSKGYVVIGWGV